MSTIVARRGRSEQQAAVRWPGGPRLPPVLQTAMLAARPVTFLEACRRRYGRCFTLNIPAWGRAVFLADPRDIQPVFHGDPGVFHVSGARGRTVALVMGRESLFMLDEERHIRHRRLLSPPFHGAKLKAFERDIRAITEDEVRRWRLGERFPLHPRLHDITLRVIIRVVFGDNEPHRTARLQDILGRLLSINPTLLVALPAVRRDLGPWSPWGRFVRVRAAADALIHDEIRRARSRHDDDAGGVIAMLAAARDEEGGGLSDEELHDELMTLLIAGEETTVGALAWAFERLTRNPDVLNRLVESLDARSDERYLDAVINESLRTRPIISGTSRILARDADVAGYRLPAGAVVIPSPVLAHTSAEHYPDPERFLPERFLDGGLDRSAWIPFGGGARRCLGASLAQLEMRIVLRTVLERFEVRPARRREERPRLHHLTLIPSRGAEVVLRPRGAIAA